MSTDNTGQLITPQPTSGLAYHDPLLKYIGNEVTVEWCDKQIEGVVMDVDLDQPSIVLRAG